MKRVQAIYDTDPDVPQQGYRFMHCGKCLDEQPDGVSAAAWARQQMAVTERGHFQLWCTRHDCNIALIELKAEEVH